MSMETYHGHVRTPLDAIILFEACRLGVLPRVQRRLSEKERQAIVSGSVFVWDEREAGMRRWTDGKSWSASRVSGSFLTYREMEGKRSEPSQGDEQDKQDSVPPQEDGMSDGYRYKPDGLMKQSFSIQTTNNLKLHLISYFSRSHITANKLIQPSLDPNLKNIPIPNSLYPDASNPFEGAAPIPLHGIQPAPHGGMMVGAGNQQRHPALPPPPHSQQGYPPSMPIPGPYPPHYSMQMPYHQGHPGQGPPGPPQHPAHSQHGPPGPYMGMPNNASPLMHSRPPMPMSGNSPHMGHQQPPQYPYPTPPPQQQQPPHYLQQGPPPPPPPPPPAAQSIKKEPYSLMPSGPSIASLTGASTSNKLARKASPLAPQNTGKIRKTSHSPSNSAQQASPAGLPSLSAPTEGNSKLPLPAPGLNKLPPPSSFFENPVDKALAGEKGKTRGVTLPGLPSFNVQDIPYEKVTWGEDARAIGVLDRGFIL